ncbi:MAG: protoporphyrinogen oxidase [Candidatus Dadabacteria bacterium]|nr:MAG: protoporphyrinogen oxidase [Candidatus Dadabacteria bacterium]
MADKFYSSAIIGGGISGLTAAYFLTKQGEEVALLDPDSLGGVIRSVKKDGFTLELGPNVFVKKEAIWKLMCELGIEHLAQGPAFKKYYQHVCYRQRAVKIPSNLIEFVLTPLISPIDKMQLLCRVFKSHSVNPSDSVGAVFRALVGGSSVSNIVAPAFRGIFGGSVDDLLFESVFPDMCNALQDGKSIFGYLKSKKRGGKREIFHIRGGNASLVESLKKAIAGKAASIKKEVCSVRVANSEDGGFILETSEGAIGCKKLYVATSGAATSRYIKGLSAEASHALSKVRYAGIIVVHVACNSSEPLPKSSFGILFPDGHMMGIMFSSILFPDMAPEGKELLTLCLGGTQKESFSLGKEAILLEIEAALKGLLGVHSYDLLGIHRWERAIPQYDIHHLEAVRELKMLESRYKNLHFIGADIGGISVPDRVALVESVLI